MTALLLALTALVAAPAPAPAAAAPSPPAGTLSGVTVAVDPGHNGGNASHPAAINRLVDAGGFKKACDTTGTATSDARLTESAFNLDVAKRLRTRLAALGARVVMTRTGDRGVGPCINRRARIGNRAKADVAISIHADGGPPSGRGFHVISPPGGRARTARIAKPSRRLAVALRDALRRGGAPTSSYIGRNGLDVRSDLGGLNLSTVPKVFVELGNMRNAAEARRLEDGRYRGRLADGLLAGVRRYLNRRPGRLQRRPTPFSRSTTANRSPRR